MRRPLLAALAFGLVFASVIWAALAAALIAFPAVPTWAIAVPAALALASVAGSAMAATAALTQPPARPQLPPVQHAERYAGRYAGPRDFLTMPMPGPGRPSADRPTPGVYQCPVRPGRPRTVADLRQWPPRDHSLRSWE